MHKKKIGLFTLIMIVGLLVSACSAKSASESVGFSEDMAPGMGFEEAAVEEERALIREAAIFGIVERMVIYNANLSIAVQDPVSAMEAIIKMAENSGGFVVYSNVYQSSTDRGQFPTASLTVRVPAGQLDLIMTAIKDLTPKPEVDVLSENVSGQDVTAEFTDLESRLRNLEAAEAQLVDLMDMAQDADDVLAIFDELTYYRGEIEVVKGRMKYLSESVNLSAISVEIVAKESLQPIEIGGWEPQGTAARAVEALINAAKFVGDAVIWFGIFCLPFLLPLGVAVYFFVRFLRKRKAKKVAEMHEVVEKVEKQ